MAGQITASLTVKGDNKLELRLPAGARCSNPPCSAADSDLKSAPEHTHTHTHTHTCSAADSAVLTPERTHR